MIQNNIYKFVTLIAAAIEDDPLIGGDTGDVSTTTFWVWFVNNLLWLLIGLVAIAVVLIIITFVLKRKNSPTTLSSEMIENVISLFGGQENIVSASLDGSRIKIKVKQLKKVDLEKIKELGALGIFVTGNLVKLMFPFNAEALIVYINKFEKES